MQRSKFEPLKKRVDPFSMLLVFFFVLLVTLFSYLMKIDSDLKHYTAYHHQLEKMRVIDYQLDSFFFRTFRYINYDEMSRLEKEFKSRIAQLKAEDVQEGFGTDVHHRIEKIAQAYQQKEIYFEDFKSLNARVTNTIHFLFDLRKTLEQELLKTPQKKVLVNNIFFSISQTLMDIPYDEVRIKEELKRLLLHEKDERLIYFVKHTKQFLRDIEMMKQIKERIKQSRLRSEINQLLAILEKHYQKQMLQQKMIALTLFIFAFGILVVLMIGYRRIRKNTRELQAFRYAIEMSDNAIVLTNADREIEYVNEAFEQKSGYTKEEVMGHNPNILKSNLMSDAFYQHMNETLERGEIWQGEIINRHKNGELVYEKSSIIPIIVDGELIQYLAIKLDITEYKRQQQYLKLAGKVYEMIGDGIIVTDKQKKIISANPAFTEMFGYTEDELIGKEPMIIKTLQEDRYFYRQMWNQLLTHDRWSGKVYNETKSGESLPIWLTLAVVRDDKGDVENFIAIYTNLKDIMDIQERAEYLAYHDSLTGLPNRAYFDLRITDMMASIQGEDETMAVFFIDLDRFKVINDTLGHAIGDEMLVTLAERMKHIFSEGTLFARIGGDEFVVMSMLERGRKEAEEIAEKILMTVREPIKVHDYLLNTTASIGIAIFPEDAKEKDEIVKYADSAMYAAKEKGKDNYQFYSKQLSLDVQQRMNLEQELTHALERNEFMLYYQPQYRLDTRKIIGVEALIRWNNQKLGFVSPNDFITIAEETGLILEIGYYVIEEACRAYLRWKREGYALEHIAINVSSVQFRDEAFLPTLKEILQRTGVSPSVIEVEITERFIMEYTTTNLTVLEDLRQLGCQISIDDFGTGYSSMSYMKKLPLDTIKIDKSFIDELPENMHDAEVSKAIIALSKSLGYQVIAEGIENEEQEVFLREQGCDMGQGYYFSRPMDEEKMVAFLKAHLTKQEG